MVETSAKEQQEIDAADLFTALMHRKDSDRDPRSHVMVSHQTPPFPYSESNMNRDVADRSVKNETNLENQKETIQKLEKKIEQLEKQLRESEQRNDQLKNQNETQAHEIVQQAQKIERLHDRIEELSAHVESLKLVNKTLHDNNEKLFLHQQIQDSQIKKLLAFTTRAEEKQVQDKLNIDKLTKDQKELSIQQQRDKKDRDAKHATVVNVQVYTKMIQHMHSYFEVTDEKYGICEF